MLHLNQLIVSNMDAQCLKLWFQWSSCSTCQYLWIWCNGYGEDL